VSRTNGTGPALAAEAIVSLIQTTIATVLGPLVGQLDAPRQTIERQAEEIAGLREERGRQSAKLERAASTVVALGEENATLWASQAQQASDPGPVASESHQGEPSVSRSARLRALAPWLLATLAIVAVVVLLVWRW
jgi:hypothetical protein